MSESYAAMQEFKGITINPGRVVAQICLFSASRHKLVPEYLLESDDEVARDLQRFAIARQECSDELMRIGREVEASIGKAEAEIFTTQRHIMNDPKVVDGVKELVTSGRKNVERAIAEVLGAFEAMMATLDNQYLRERLGDISEVRLRLLNKLSNETAGFICEGQRDCRRGAQRIIVAEELTPSMIVNMDMEKVQGFVTEHGGMTSHAAILARSLGVPAVSGIENIMQKVTCGDTLLVNGDTGQVFLHPDRNTIQSLIQSPPSDQVMADIAVTPEGMEVAANASTLEDVRQAVAVHADGIGLFRTEILFVGAERLMTEEEQYAFYLNVQELMGDKSVTFRLLDIGGDKPLPFLRLKKEANPFLGWRGARFLLGNPDIFSTQMRALGRLSKRGPVRILFPMIIDAAQVRSLIEMARSALSGVEHDSGRIAYGAMFEVPSAIMQALEIMREVAFASIGSNDLIQYTFALDRDNEMVAADYNPDHPALWRFFTELSTIARDCGKPLSICGEMAGREGMASRLLETGIMSLSVSPRLVPRVRGEMVRYARLLDTTSLVF
ncbi:MAG: phosphoenolpyruvate--protein phosphotransferase [Chitinispirillaceae bacterium]|nr:phosphoenolpyruvate--protein phosphotransferase [Chitinispirillaceae bacterium]